MRVLVVAQDQQLGQRIADGINQRAFRSDLAGSLAAADGDLELIRYDAVILQLPLPDGDGLAWLARRRLHPAFPPVLVMTAYDAICDRVASLDAGADDCLVNPADSDEIAARLRALLRRPGPRTPPVLHVGALEFDVAARRLLCHEVELPLTHKEAELLELLMRRVGTVVRKSVITDALYGFDEEVTPNAVEALVSRLRHKIGAANGHAGRTALRRSIRCAAWATCCARCPGTPPGRSTCPRPGTDGRVAARDSRRLHRRLDAVAMRQNGAESLRLLENQHLLCVFGTGNAIKTNNPR